MTFMPRENPDGYWQVAITEVPFKDKGVAQGSYNVLQARLLGLSYPDYLQFCRANYNGILRGREGYSYCLYKEKSDCQKVCQLINKEWNKVENFLKEN